MFKFIGEFDNGCNLLVDFYKSDMFFYADDEIATNQLCFYDNLSTIKLSVLVISDTQEAHECPSFLIFYEIVVRKDKHLHDWQTFLCKDRVRGLAKSLPSQSVRIEFQDPGLVSLRLKALVDTVII